MRPLNPNADRISDLPDYVIDIILSRVPLRDAVRTSLLSTEWRYKWTSIPDLVFDPVFLLLKYSTENIVDQVLLQHRGTINKFVFKVPRHINSLNVDKWIQFLSNHQVQDFTLLRRNLNYRMPSRFFEFQHLRHLNLYRCILELPLGFKGFSRLVSLSCYQIDFTPAIFRQLVSQCPQLEKLRVFHWSKSDAIEVEGPKLRFFQFRGLFQSICFKNCPVLAEISLSTPKDDSSETLRSSYPKKYIHFVPTLEKVDLDTQMLEYLGAGGAPNRFPSSLNHLRVLSFSFFLDVVEEMSFALCLVRSSPNLQILRIRFHGFSIVEAIVEYIRVQKTPECSMNQLKKVEIAGFSGTECQVEFVAYLLAGAGALEEMALSVCRGYDGLGLTNQLRCANLGVGPSRGYLTLLMEFPSGCIILPPLHQIFESSKIFILSSYPSWDVWLIWSLFSSENASSENADAILRILISVEPKELVWTPSKLGSFSTKSSYLSTISSRIFGPINPIWEKLCYKRYTIVTNYFGGNAVPIGIKLNSIFPILDKTWPICITEDEFIEHLF